MRFVNGVCRVFGFMIFGLVIMVVGFGLLQRCFGLFLLGFNVEKRSFGRWNLKTLKSPKP